MHYGEVIVKGVSEAQPLKPVEDKDRTWASELSAMKNYLMTIAHPGGGLQAGGHHRMI